MEAGDAALPVSPAAGPTSAPARRWKKKLLLGLVLLLGLGAGLLLLLLLRRQPAVPQIGLLKFQVANPYVTPMRMATLRVENRSASTLVFWEPCRLERRETGKLTVGSSSSRVQVLRSTNAVGLGPVVFLSVQLTGTNHGPWRVLVPVARYEWVARLEKLFSKPSGSLVKQLRVVDFLLQHSRTWVASDWFEEQSSSMNVAGGPSLPGVPGRPPGGFSAGSWPRSPTFQTHQNDFQTFAFILRNFGARYRRWPRNMEEVKKFAADKANFQPEVPPEFLGEEYATAVFSTTADGGLRIEHSHGSMSLGGVPK